MPKSKEQKRREANQRNLVNHFTLVAQLVNVLPGGKGFDMEDYRIHTTYIYGRIRSLVSAIQSSCRTLHCTMVGHIDDPSKENYIMDPTMAAMVEWDPKSVINWLLDDNLAGFVNAVNDEIINHPAHTTGTGFARIPFDRHIYDVIYAQIKFYLESQHK